MIKSKLLATAFAVAALSFTSAQANDVPAGMEVCVIKSTATAKTTDVVLPTGQCAKVLKGDISGLTDELKAEVEAAKNSH